MEINRDERRAKTQALGMLALMALVAITVHYWPRDSAVVMTSRPVVAAPPTAAAEHQPAPPARMRVSVPAHRPGPRPVASVEPVITERPRASQPSSPDITSLLSLPGAPIAIPSAPAPSAGNGAVTRAMQTTGKSLAGVFKKTGSAFRRAF